MIERMFNTDNNFWQAVGKAGDLIALTFLTLLCSIPLITAGPAFCAMNYVCFKMLEHDNEGTIKNFFHSFRQNLFQGAAISLIMGAIGFLLWYDGWFLVKYFAGQNRGVLLCAGWAIYIYLIFFYLVLALYVFPFQARFYNPLAVTFKNAVLAGFKHLPKTLMMLVGDGSMVLLIILSFKHFPQIAFLPLLTALPLCVWYHSWVLRDLLGLIPGKLDLPVSDDEAERRESHE